MNSLKYSTTLILAASGLLMGCSQYPNAQSLDSRFDRSGSVKFVQDGVSAMGGDVSAMASGLQVSLGLTINPPLPSQTDGVQVYASDLRVAGNRVITGYNVRGATQKGWVDFIDVTTLAVPLRLSSQYFADTDINSIAMANGKVALVGAKENVGAVMRTGTYDALAGLTIGATVTNLSSYAGTGAAFDTTASKLFVTSGDTGGINVLNPTTLASITSYTLGDARGITYHAGTNRFYAVKGQTGEVHSFDVNGNHLTYVAIGNATVPESKSTIVAGTNFLLATKGDGGFSVICASDMKVAATQSQFIYPNYAAAGLPGPALTVTNAAAFGPGMIFTASGEAGVRVYNFVKASGTSPTACQNVTVSYLGYFEFNTGVSANNLVYANILTTALNYSGVLYVADGAGGFKAVTVAALRNSLNDILEF